MDTNRSERIREIENKCRRVVEVIRTKGLGGIFLRQQKNFSWITAGASNPVITNHDPGFAGVLVTSSGRYLITQNVEAPRIEDEELEGLGFEFVVHPWWKEDLEEALASLSGPGATGVDWPLNGAPDISKEIAVMRPVLLGGEPRRMSALGRDLGQGMHRVCRSLEPGMTEHQVSGMLAKELLAEGIRPILYLAAADERTTLYRHAVPTRKPIENICIMSICAERHGLIAAATRIVGFGSPSSEITEKYEALLQVDAALISGCRPGVDIADAFAAGCRAYENQGYPGEWQNHFQGGLIAYAEREVLGSPDTHYRIEAGQALAWNPTISGTKAEDTFIIGENGFENITLDRDWPTRVVDYDGFSLSLPEIMIRS